MNNLKKLLLILLIAVVYSACSDSSTGLEDDGSPITIDVNVHLMRSGESENLTATLDEDEIDVLFEGVNEVWAQASISWNVASIDEVEAQNVEQFKRMMKGEISFSSSLMGSVLPENNASSDAWDLFIIKNLGGFVGGIYFQGPTAVLQPEVDPNGEVGFDGGLIRITAHELGHSMSLQHVPCVSPGNLMAPGCRVGTRTLLNESQIQQSREQALSGRPFDGS